jgi:hypothetical protein
MGGTKLCHRSAYTLSMDGAGEGLRKRSEPSVQRWNGSLVMRAGLSGSSPLVGSPFPLTYEELLPVEESPEDDSGAL